MNKYTALAAGLLLGGSLIGPATAAPGNNAQAPSARRGDLVHAIVMKWGKSVKELTKTDVRSWATLMGPLFNKASMDKLQKAADAKTFQAMNNALLGITPSVLGSTTDDLVYVPVTPCRIFDTRPTFGGSGPIAANTTKDFDVTAIGGTYAFQGGAATDCGTGNTPEEFPAAVINFTTVNPVGAGYITAFPGGGTPRPTAATVNYAGGDIRGNLAIVQFDLFASLELSVYSFKTTNVVGDIVGYFIRPQATALDCTFVQNDFTVPPGGTSAFATCPTGYSATGGGCSPGFGTNTLNYDQPGFADPATWYCNVNNPTASNTSANVSARCCRTPGR